MSRRHENDDVHALMEAPLATQRELLARWGLPEAGLLILMSKCLGRCFFCAQRVVTNPPPAMITRWDPVDAWLEGNRTQGVARLCLGGTEPPTHPDFYRTLDRAREVGFTEVELMTSAVQLAHPVIVQRWWDHGVRTICAPIYGATAAEHDRVVQVEGHWERLVRGVDLARRRGMSVHLHTLALRRTLDALPGLAAFVRDRWETRLTVAPLRPKDMFDYRAEAVGFDALTATLADADVSLVGFPTCVLPDKPRQAPLLIEVYFKGQRTTYAEEVCAGCAARERCPGLVAMHAEVHGAEGLTPR
ncbi:MAG: radical SAM protein [Deltaproteobacteria bacterium]|nr:MAG: radical SAM protein [Deltaproteobacteria bacterium]